MSAAVIIYECTRCHFCSAQAVDVCPNCGAAKSFRSVQRFTEATQSPSTLYVCQNCRYQAQAPLEECPGCGHLRTMATFDANDRPFVRPTSARPYGSGTGVLYGCRNLACTYRSEQWSEKCPRCGKSLRTANELKNLSLAFGLIFVFIGSCLLLLDIFLVFAISGRTVKTDAWWALALIFAIGGVFILGGLSGIKGRWWLFRVLIGFTR